MRLFEVQDLLCGCEEVVKVRDGKVLSAFSGPLFQILKIN